MIITDTHTHLYSEAFDEDRDEMISRALAAGITRFFVPAIDSTYSESMYALERKYPTHVFLMMGVHPTHIKDNYKEELDFLTEALETRKFVAIGEIGIDLYWDKSFLKKQQEAFDLQIRWAKEKKLPVVIHCRDGFDEVFEVLQSHRCNNLSGIFHCFTGTKEQAEMVIDMNFKLGIGGVVTFKNGKIDKFLDQISIDHIVLETDAPYLAPAPYRGKRNQSEYLVYILKKLTEIYQKSEKEIAAITTKNALSVFKF